MAWAILFLAAAFEISWVIGMKFSEGYTKLVPSALTILGMVLSMWLLGVAAKTLPLGTSYAIWTGIGAVGAMVAGIVLFGETASALRIGSAALIVVGITGLKLTS